MISTTTRRPPPPSNEYRLQFLFYGRGRRGEIGSLAMNRKRDILDRGAVRKLGVIEVFSAINGYLETLSYLLIMVNAAVNHANKILTILTIVICCVLPFHSLFCTLKIKRSHV